VRFNGRSIVGLAPHAICRLGLARTFQIVRPFPHMTVLENVRVGALARHPRAPEALAQARDVVARVGLAGRAPVPAAAAPPAEIGNHPKVVEAYLGEEYVRAAQA